MKEVDCEIDELQSEERSRTGAGDLAVRCGGQCFVEIKPARHGPWLSRSRIGNRGCWGLTTRLQVASPSERCLDPRVRPIERT